MNDPALPVLRDANRYLLTLAESAVALGITRRQLDQLIQQGKLTRLFFKGRAFIAAYEIDWYLLSKKGIERMLWADENLFTGANPYLMSLLQTPGVDANTSLYPSFHSDHITHIKDHLNRYLPRHYIAMTEHSLQIKSREEEEEAFRNDTPVKPDVTIYHRYPSVPFQTGTTASPAIELSLRLAELKTLHAVNIYEIKPSEPEKRGIPLVRIELLSPANMPKGRHEAAYLENRTKCLLADTILVEVDYLHEYPSPVQNMPRYPQEETAKAFNVAVTNPKTNKIHVYFFGINEPLPLVTIPLSGDDHLIFNFGEPYQFTWDTSRFGMDIDYAEEPLRMNRYSEADQQAIRQQMKVIQDKLRGH